jgi:hypothetical protein
MVDPSQEKENESGSLGKLEDSEFAFQTSWVFDGEQTSRLAL